MIVLEVNLDKCFPVVVAVVYLNVIEHIAIKLKIICNTQLGKIGSHIARTFK